MSIMPDPADNIGELPSRSYLVLQALKRWILDGTLKPGQQLVERELATKLGVSKTPIREALRMLSQGGLVTSSVHRGTSVRTVNADDVRHVYGLRLLLEPEAVRQAVAEHRGGPPDAKGFLMAARRSIAAGDLAALSVANRRFHAAMYAQCDNSYLVDALDNLQDQLALISVTGWRLGSDWELEASQHEAIFEAAADSDANRAGRLTFEHIEGFLTRFLANVDRQPAIKLRPGAQGDSIVLSS